MPALELLTGIVTAPGATETALTMAADNSLSVRFADPGADIRLLNMWAYVQGTGIFKVHSPKFHDNVQGVRFRTVVADPSPLLPWDFNQKLYPQDDMIATLSGSAVAGDIETGCFLVYYSELPGVLARLINSDQVKQSLINMFTVEVSLTLGAAGNYSGEVPINDDFDLFKANTDYALIGYSVDVACAAVRFRGSDTGNLGIGGPGLVGKNEQTRRWFANISDMTGLDCIPVFNSANKFGIFVDGAQNENAANVNVSIIMAQIT